MLKKIKVILLILFNTVFLFFLLLVGLFYYGKSQIVREIKVQGEWGYPAQKKHSIKFAKYNAQLKFDSKIFKINSVVNKQLKKDHQKHILLLGGSNTMGEELRDEEALEAQLISLNDLSDYHPYVLAYMGWGPHNILGYFHKIGLADQIKESSGIAIYQLIQDHHSRVCGHESYFAWSSGAGPKYKSKAGKLIFQGMYADTFEYKQALVKMGLSALFKKEKVKGEINPTQKCRELLVDIILEMRNIYLERFPKSRFVVTTIPVYHEGVETKENPDFMRETIDMLKSAGVETYDPRAFYKEEFKLQKAKRELLTSESGHVTAKYYELMLPFFKKIILKD